MLIDIVEARACGETTLYVRFEDGADGKVDVKALVDFPGLVAPLSDPGEFARVQLAWELGTVCWPNGADLDPDVLYEARSGSRSSCPLCSRLCGSSTLVWVAPRTPVELSAAHCECTVIVL